VAVWLSGNIVGRINEVTLRRAGLVLKWVTVSGYTDLVFNQATHANSAFHPSGVGKSNTGLLVWGEGGAAALNLQDRKMKDKEISGGGKCRTGN